MTFRHFHHEKLHVQRTQIEYTHSVETRPERKHATIKAWKRKQRPNLFIPTHFTHKKKTPTNQIVHSTDGKGTVRPKKNIIIPQPFPLPPKNKTVKKKNVFFGKKLHFHTITKPRHRKRGRASV